MLFSLGLLDKQRKWYCLNRYTLSTKLSPKLGSLLFVQVDAYGVLVVKLSSTYSSQIKFLFNLKNKLNLKVRGKYFIKKTH